MIKKRKIIFPLIWLGLCGGFGATMMAAGAFLYLSPKLPSAESYREVRLENPLRIFTSDGKLIAEFGDKKRDPLKIEEVPTSLINALIASEDSRFYRHNGVDFRALARSVVGILRGNLSGGGSTLTMQVAKNISFAGEDPYSRKFKEILLAMQIERELSKQEILELYLNLSFFGISAYGISAAADQYYNKSPSELSLAEMAMLVAMLPAPNAYNPLRSPERALSLRHRVLRRMHEQGMISDSEYAEAENSPITASRYGRQRELAAPYIAELVRQEMVERYGMAAMTDGYEVYTTIDSRMQEAANLALNEGLESYDRRHGYRGPENQFAPGEASSRQQWLDILADTATIADQIPAFVENVEERSMTVLLGSGISVELDWEGIRWAKRFINADAWGSTPGSAHEVAEVGDMVRITRDDAGNWMLGQVPEVNGGLVALNPGNGGIRAMVGGYDFNASKFNRITQAERQPGSNFKPFLYSAALDNGYTAASLINDAPLARSDYRPQNFSGRFMGPIRLSYALTNSKNLVSLRLYDALGSDVVLPYVSRFGFDDSGFPRNDLTVAIGSHAVTPLSMATAYAVFANGGYKVEPYLIERIENFNDGVVFQADPLTACDPCTIAQTSDPGEPEADMADTEADATAANADIADETDTIAEAVANGGIELSLSKPPRSAPRVIDERTIYMMNTILRSVITNGSGRPANRAIDRNDIHGKTGTTNDAADLWFSGFTSDLVASVYVGYDTPSTLGRSEQAATVALPIWIDFMKPVLEGMPEHTMPQPDGLVTTRINPDTGLRARPGEPGAIFEVFRVEDVPGYGNSRNDREAREALTGGDEESTSGHIF